MSEQTTTPAWPAVDELRPGETHNHQRLVLDVNSEIFDEIEKSWVRPVQILDDDQKRLHRSKTLDQPPGCEEQESAIASRRVHAYPSEQRDVAGRLFDFRGRQQLLDHR